MADPFRMTEENGQTTDGSTTTGHRVDDGKVRVADLGGYHVRDIEFVAAFDIDSEKVGKDLSEAIWSGQNDTIKFADVPNLGVTVQRGMTHDGLGKYLKEKITKAPGPTADIVGVLKETKADVLVCYLPVGSEQATKWYVEQALKAEVGFVNCLPVFIAREDYWDRRFTEAGLPIIGDDIKSQVGATIVHRQLARLFAERGHLDHGPRAARRRRLHRSLRLRPVAHRSQVGAHPGRGKVVRRRPAQRR